MPVPTRPVLGLAGLGCRLPTPPPWGPGSQARCGHAGHPARRGHAALHDGGGGAGGALGAGAALLRGLVPGAGGAPRGHGPGPRPTLSGRWATGPVGVGGQGTSRLACIRAWRVPCPSRSWDRPSAASQFQGARPILIPVSAALRPILIPVSAALWPSSTNLCC
jgi:hypothetical protein